MIGATVLWWTAALALAGAPEAPSVIAPALRFDQARRLFDAGRYVEAAEQFRQLHHETGEVAVLYPAAQSLRLADRCADALAAYEGFVSAAPELERRTRQVAPGSDAKRIAGDIDYARAYIVEMRICAGHDQAQHARAHAQARLALGDLRGARTALEHEWESTRDPTLLLDLARVQRRLGECTQAATRVQIAIDTLGAVEILDQAATVTPHVAHARQALDESRHLRDDPSCAPVVIHRVKAPDDGVIEIATRPRWPIWIAGAGATLLAAGGVSWALLHRTETQLAPYEMHQRAWDAQGDRLLRQGHEYQWGAILLSAGGAAVAGTALILYHAQGRAPASAAPRSDRLAASLSLGGGTLIWNGSF